ncbi:hypothetical protein EH223_00905 [candidate division KSB1 bacterium]|nr:hypothetical protein [candidate division KSB1 bacterium]RQW07211.1 MAG: hypothetical protein EH223_00905 [candidate division KSB1 bacterium]
MINLKKILSSDVFAEKLLYQNLLKYLVNCSLKEITPKEVTIAQDVFHKSADFNASEDSTVRVHMHNLRNKLDEYYRTDGSSDEFRLLIPKGHYQVRLVKNEILSSRRKHQPKDLAIFVLGIAFILLLLYTVIKPWIAESKHSQIEAVSANNRFWRHFFSNEYPIFIVLGDFLVFHEYHDKLDRPRRIQDYEINTPAQFDTFLQNYPENSPEIWDLGEVPHNAIYNILDIAPVFYSFCRKPDIRFTSNIDIDFIKKRNIIYIGEFKNLRALTDLVTTLPISFKTLPWWHGTITFPKGDSLISLGTSRDWEVSRYVIDLGIIAKLPGHNYENYIICAGFGYNAQIKIVDLITHESSLQLLEEQIKSEHGIIPDYFTLVVEVKGFDRASTTFEIKFFTAVDRDHYLKSYSSSLPINE